MAVLVLDAAYIITEANPAAAHLLQTPVDRLIGHHVLEAVSDQALVTAIINIMGDLAPGSPRSQQVPGSATQPPLGVEAQRAPPAGRFTSRFAAWGSRMAMLTWERKDGQRMVFHLQGLEATVGRDVGNVIRLESGYVSKRHAVIRLGPQGYTITDLNSSNGTFVNSQRTSLSLLKDGDRIELGSEVLVFSNARRRRAGRAAACRGGLAAEPETARSSSAPALSSSCCCSASS